MQLKIEMIGGADAGSARLVDGSQAFSMGTKTGAVWPFRQDEGSSPGMAHVRRSIEGFEIIAEGAVTLDGRPLVDGEPFTLGPGAIIELAGHSLRVSLLPEGQIAPASYGAGTGENPTISAILSDVSPGGDTAHGPLPGHSGEAWLDALTQEDAARKAPAQKQNDVWATLGLYGEAEAKPTLAAPTNPVVPMSTHLPDDWDAPGDAQNRVVQSDAPTAALAISVGKSLDRATSSSELDPAVHAFLKAAEITPDELSGAPVRQMAALGALLRDLLDGVARLEAAQNSALAEMEAAPLSRDGSLRDLLLLASAQDPAAGADTVRERLDDLVKAQRALADGPKACLDAARKRLDPDIITTELASEGRLAARLRPDATAWQTYCTRWTGLDREPAIPPLSDAALSQEVRRRLRPEHKTEQDT